MIKVRTKINFLGVFLRERNKCLNFAGFITDFVLLYGKSGNANLS